MSGSPVKCKYHASLYILQVLQTWRVFCISAPTAHVLLKFSSSWGLSLGSSRAPVILAREPRCMGDSLHDLPLLGPLLLSGT